MAVNVTPNSRQSYNRHELLAWLNETLNTCFTEVEQVCTGVAYCQLMHLLFPGSLDLSMVRFQSKDILDSINNYSVLRAAFRKVGVVRYIPIEALVMRSHVVSLTFLHWFKVFFDKNKSNRGYHASEPSLGPSILSADSDDISSQSLLQKTEVIITISDSDDDYVVAGMTENTDKLESSVKEACAQLEEIQSVERADAVDGENQVNRLITYDTLLCFIGRYLGDTEERKSSLSTGTCVPSILTPSHPKDIIQACSHTPYCLYLYTGVELDAGQSTSIILIGYFDQRSGVNEVKLLQTLQMSMDTVDAQTPADLDTDAVTVTHTGDSDAHLLIALLKKCGLALSNLAVFYCNAPNPGVSQMFVSQLKAFNPMLISLCGLPGMAGRACQSGLLASFKCVVDLVRDIHHHYSTCPSAHDSLKGVFTHAESYNQSCPISQQCLYIARIVQNMLSRWSDLVKYFTSLNHSEDTDSIRTQLTDCKVKLQFLFLSYSLEPLQAFQELQQSGTGDVAMELQMASLLIHICATNILRPSVAERFLRRRDLCLLHNEKDLLALTEVNIGFHARDFLQSSTAMDLGEPKKNDFLKAVVMFYKALLRSLVQSLPEHLGDTALRNINKVLKHPETSNDTKLSRQVLSELGVQLGVCRAGSPESYQLVEDYFILIKAERDKQANRSEDGHCWAKMTRGLRSVSPLHRFMQTLLAIPSSLSRMQVFAKVLPNINDPCDDNETAAASWLNRWARRLIAQRRRPPFDGDYEPKKEEDSSTEDSSDVSVAKPGLRNSSKHSVVVEDSDSDYTDNSSDVVDVTQVSRTPGTFTRRPSSPPAASVFILSSDDDIVPSTSTPPTLAGLLGVHGELVWGKVEGFSVWPAIIVSCERDNNLPRKSMVEWFGQRMTSQVSLQDLKPFASFGQYFCPNSFATLVTYREAIFLSLQEAAVRCKKQLSACLDDKEVLLQQMLDWAFGGFQPSGPGGLKPAAFVKDATIANRPQVKEKCFQKATSSPQSSTPASSNISPEMNDMAASNKLSHSSIEKPFPKGKAKGKCYKKKHSLSDGFDNDTPDFLPYKRRTFTRTHSKGKQGQSDYTQPDQKLRAETICRIVDRKLDIDGFCLCCGTENVTILHPLFKGSLCRECKDNFAETLYRYDDDGYQSYCTICCYGLEVLLCGNDSCCRSYCAYCLNILVGPGTFDALKSVDPWVCYLCQPHQPHGSLVPREDWSLRVQELFANNSAIEFEPHRVYPSIPANRRRPVRVLSLFDGIATGYLVLKELGFKVEKYVASEVCEDSVAVAAVNHDGKIVHVGDTRFITQEHLKQWGPFDLLIGGSPCNDLSIVNPLRKGLYEGTGRLFFEFYRILQLLKPKEEESRPFFWLFENVVFMNTHDKVNICRFLECNPVLVDAVKVSPAHRARYFWGNIPGMCRPITAAKNDKLGLQDCLEIGREARVTKVRTITTNPNSLKQGKNVSLLPVLHNGKEDNLWITELERIFGFPKHYTDVRNMNRLQRQKVLGKAWSVPVIRHLFAPLKDYFACEELPSIATSS